MGVEVFENLSFNKMCEIVHECRCRCAKFIIFNDRLIDGYFKDSKRTKFNTHYIVGFDETLETLVVSLKGSQKALPYWLINDNHWGVCVSLEEKN